MRSVIVDHAPKKWLSTEELAKYLGQTSRWVRENIKNDPCIPCYHIKKQTLWKVSDIDSLIERNRL